MTPAGAPGVSPQPTVISPTQAALESLAETREASLHMRTAADSLLELARLAQEPPEFHTIVINPNNNGSYVCLNKSRWQAKSIGIINPTSVPVFVGVGGVSATPNSRALACAAESMLVLPVLAQDLELGADPAVLLGNTLVCYLLRFLTVQPLNVQLLG